jgi:hypothetical protein
VGGILRKLALKAGARKFLGWFRAAHDGAFGPETKARVDLLLANAAWLGLVLGSAVAALGILYGQDSKLVGAITGYIAPQLLMVGLIPEAWDKTQPESWTSYSWYQFLRNWSSEIGVAITGWWTWSTFGECAAAGGLHVGPLLVACGYSTFACALLAGLLTHLGIISSATLARPPITPVPAAKG